MPDGSPARYTASAVPSARIDTVHHAVEAVAVLLLIMVVAATLTALRPRAGSRPAPPMKRVRSRELDALARVVRGAHDR